MSTDKAQLVEWWERLSEDQQGRLKRAVQSYPVDPSIPNLLASTRCPVLVSSAMSWWTSVPGSESVTLSRELSKFIQEHIDDDE